MSEKNKEPLKLSTAIQELTLLLIHLIASIIEGVLSLPVLVTKLLDDAKSAIRESSGKVT